MEVKLVVTNGRHTGREIPIKGPKFFVGRAEDCHLRPGSDLVSRHHCVILVEDGLVAVRDFGSKNGTFVNGEQVMPEQELKDGDRLVIGQLDFNVKFVGAPVDEARPTEAPTETAQVPKPAEEAAAAEAPAVEEKPEPVEPKAEPEPVAKKPEPAAKKKEPAGKDTVGADGDLDISQWFGDDDDASAKTDTQTIDMSTLSKTGTGEIAKDEEPDEEDDEKRDVSEAEKEAARRAGAAQTTQDAAAEMLKKFFNARR